MSYLKDLLGDLYKEGMSEEEIDKALEEAKIGKPVDPPKEPNSAEIEKYKNMLSKANSEAAEYKKQLRAKQTEEEAQKAEHAELLNKLTEENNSLKRSVTIGESQAKLLAMGYDATLAESTATAMADGDMDTVMKNQTAFLEAQKKQIEADAMKQTPRPPAGNEPGKGEGQMTRADFHKMSMKERSDFYKNHREEYDAIYANDAEGSDAGTDKGGNE